MQQAIACICLLGAAGIVGYVILAAYIGWKAVLIPIVLAVVILAIIRRDRRVNGPM